MAPFIRYTDKGGEQVFLNAAAILKAEYQEKTEKLTVYLAATTKHGQAVESAVLEGRDATEAVKVLRELV